MIPLRLPEYSVGVRGDVNKEIHCLIRKRYVALTQEEWVRQHFINLLITHLHYPKGMIRLEQPLAYFKSKKRSDITVLNSEGKVHLLVECKSYKINLGQSSVRQVAVYDKVLKALYLAVTNGLKHFVWKKENKKWIHIKEFPSYP